MAKSKKVRGQKIRVLDQSGLLALRHSIFILLADILRRRAHIDIEADEFEKSEPIIKIIDNFAPKLERELAKIVNR